MASPIELLLLAAAVPLLKEGASGSWALDWSQADTSFNTNANLAGTQPLSRTWTIDAGNAQVGTVYEVEVPFNGTFENQTLNLGVSLNGSATGGEPQNAQLGSAFFTAGQAFTGYISLRLQVITTGSGGTCTIWVKGGIAAATTLSSAGVGGTVLNGRQISLAFNTTVANTIAVGSQWGGSTAGQTITGYGSTFTRKGP